VKRKAVLIALFCGLLSPSIGRTVEEADLPVSLSTGIGIGLRNTAQTTDASWDKRLENMGKFEVYLRSTYFQVEQDLSPKFEARLSLGTRLTTDDQFADEDDPSAGRLTLSLRDTGLRVFPIGWLNIELGVVASPWETVSAAAWGIGSVSGGAARRYGFVSGEDLGIGFFGDLPAPRAGLRYQTAFTNGETRLRIEDEKYKAVQSCLGFHPLPFDGKWQTLTAFVGYGYRVMSDEPGPARRAEHFCGLLLAETIGRWRFGWENDLLLGIYRTDDNPTPSVLSSLYAVVNIFADWDLFLRGDGRDYDLRNDPRRDSIVESQRKDHVLKADEDIQVTVLGGVAFKAIPPLYLSPYVESTFYQEPARDGGMLAPSFSVNLGAAMRF